MRRTMVMLMMAAFSGLFISAGTFAQGSKIAVADMEQIFKEYYKTKVADANLRKQAEVFKEYAEKLNDSLVKLQDEFKKLRDDAQNIALSDVERENKRLAAQDKYRQMKEKEDEFKQYSTDKQGVLRNQYEDQRAKLLDEIKNVIQRKAVAEGYDVVLDSSGKTLNNIPSIIYFKSAMDLTDVVIKEINLPAKEKFQEVMDKAPKDAKDTKDSKTEKKENK